MGLLRAGLSASETQAAQQAPDTLSDEASPGTDLAPAESGSLPLTVSATAHVMDEEEDMEVSERESTADFQKAEQSVETPQESSSEPLLKWDRPIVFR